MCLTVCHQVFNSHERHIVFIGKLNTLWCTRHRAIVISQLTQYTSRFKACQRHQINSCFSMTATRQYTTCLWLILGSMISPVVMAAIMAAVAGIMVALSVDELMPLAKEIDPNNNPSYGVLCGMSVMGFSLVLLQTAGIG